MTAASDDWRRSASSPPTTPWVEIQDPRQLDDLITRVMHPVVVAFEDSDCGHCRAHRAMLNLAWRQLGWRLSTALVDGRRLPELAEHHKILGYPTLLVFSGGRLVERISGRGDARSVLRRLERLHGLTSLDGPSPPPAPTAPVGCAGWPEDSPRRVGDRPGETSVHRCPAPSSTPRRTSRADWS